MIFFLSYFSLIYPFLQQLARGFGKNKMYAYNGLIYTICFLTFNGVFLIIFRMSYEALFLSSIFSFLISSIILIFQLKLFNYVQRDSINKKMILSLLKYSIPLVPNT